jgi:hypothetical protein
LKRTYEGLPDFYRETSFAVVIKLISIDYFALVVSSQQEEVFRIFDLQLLFKINWNNCEHLVGEKKANGF